MAISEDLKAKILRYHHVEKWRVGTIANQLGVHHTTIKNLIAKTCVEKSDVFKQPSIIDPFLTFILETLDQYPKLAASRLYSMVQERGYEGGPDHFRHMISVYRPRSNAEAFLRLRTLAGEQAQVDWGHFGHIQIGEAKRPLMAFVMVLSYSRKIFLHFYLNQRTANFLRGHEKAFKYFNGIPRVLLYDNLKSAVLERKGDAIKFNQTLLSFASHYHFEPRPVAVYRGNEKGRVERAIRYIRDNFFAARTYNDLDDLNSQAKTWCDVQASNRPCPEDKTQKVQDVFEKEQPHLITLPDNPYICDEIESVSVAKTPYVRFDLNDYSVPHTYVRKSLTVQATLKKVTIIDGNEVVATHERSYDKAKQIESAEHIEALIKQKKQASKHRGQDRLTITIDCANEFLQLAATMGYSLTSTTKQLINLLDDYGATLLEEAMNQALIKKVPHPNAVRIALQKISDEKNKVPLIKINHTDKIVNEVVVKTHALNNYDGAFNLKSESESK